MDKPRLPPLGGRSGTGAAKTNVPPSVVVARTEDSLTLLNGDRLQGRLVGVDASGVLTWQHKAMLEPLRCSTVALDKVELLPRKAEGSRHQQHIVRLVNGDRLCGDVITLDTTQLVFKTWYAGTLNIARSHLASLSPAAVPTGVLYEGPSEDLTGWLVSGDESVAPVLAYHKGALVLPLGRVCGRRIPKLPAKACFDLELGNWVTAGFLFSFFCDDPRRMEGDAYHVNFSGGRIEFQRRAGEGEERSLGALDLPEQMTGRKRMRVTILADRQERRFTLLLDGRVAHEFRDTQEFKAKVDHSEYIAFVGMDAASLRIFRVSVAPWDGRIPKAESEDGAPVERDTLILSNGDNIAGMAYSIAQDSAKFKTAFGELAVPLERIASLRFANKPVPTNGTVRCCFNDQDAVTLTLEKLAAETLVGTAEGIGPLKFPLGACTRLEFNPTIKRVTEDDDEL